MAQLKRSVRDGHYFIYFGKSRGTWQIDDANLPELERLAHISRPKAWGDSIHFNGIWWGYLRDRQLIKIRYEPYNHRDRDDDMDEVEGARLPLLLNLDRQSDLIRSWSLAIELRGIPEETRAEAQERRAAYLSVNDALGRRLYLNHNHPLSAARVAPQSTPYEIAWFDASGRKLPLGAACFSEGLNDTVRGNVFAETNEHAWRRCLPGSSVTFWGTLHWLAADRFRPDWPGTAEQWGFLQDDWRLWRLTTGVERPVTWQAIADWLNGHGLTLAFHTQHLRLITPPLAITQEGWSLVSRDHPLIIGCTPPARVTPGVRSRLQLAVTKVDGGRDSAVDVAPGLQQDVAPDKPWFARWSHPQPGDYRIHAVGSVAVEPLLVRVLSDATARLAAPAQLQGLTCRLAADDHSETLVAFAGDENPRITNFSETELPHLQWELQPPGLPVVVKWHLSTAQGEEWFWPERIVTSDKELTALWRDEIWPASTSAGGIELKIEGESFGRIECVIGLPSSGEPVQDHALTAAQRAELTWLAQLCLAPVAQPRISMSADLRLALSRIQALESHMWCTTTTRAAVTLLRRQQAIPAWIAPRLRALVAIEHG